MLLNKLVDISQGRGISVAPHDIKVFNSSVYHSNSIMSTRGPATTLSMQEPTPEKPQNLLKMRSSSHVVVTERPSLNYVSRKRENERIERENHIFAKRLFSNCATIRKVELDDSYAVVSKIKQRIKRYRKLEPLPISSTVRSEAHMRLSKESLSRADIAQSPYEEIT